ncbi:hypothetical protein CEXT_89601 [Caerostris extrusa]|uniref:Uncharacterized protein n=1 Tax=Caerostris extrusa TaxID=172846 RepID=A0AAV4YAF4_CAEEX|nr:hypothetical protein CEXT_89601 [Caerostris extrusa]
MFPKVWRVTLQKKSAQMQVRCSARKAKPSCRVCAKGETIHHRNDRCNERQDLHLYNPRVGRTFLPMSTLMIDLFLAIAALLLFLINQRLERREEARFPIHHRKALSTIRRKLGGL